MSASALRPAIEHALAAFASRPLPEAARAFFATLGYRSERRMGYPSLKAFLSEYDRDGRASKLFPDETAPKARSAPVLIQQFTGGEISASSSGQLLLAAPSAEETRASIRRDFDSYLFLSLSLAEADCARGLLAERARALNSLFRQPVLVLFHHGGRVSLAITYRRTNRRDQSRDVIGRKVTLIMDVACGRPHRAHLDILAGFALPALARPGSPIRTFAQLDDAWRRVLSTQQLNESFYRELAAWYHWAFDSIRLPIIADHLRDHERADEENRKQFVIRLLSRTLFCWFLKERRLIEPRLLELHDDAGRPIVLFDHPARQTPAQFATGSHYYRGILQNIFFNCLNTPMDARRHPTARAREDRTVSDPALRKLAYRGKNYLPPDFDYATFDRIPYLNGGLFDVLQEDNASDTIDDAKISVPNFLFYATDADDLKITVAKKIRPVVGLNTLLARYKFTITENTPLEEEIALDPELLGLVFENLLAEVDSSDPAAAESARKASGSYYTPRRIIDYMVNESLRLHLENFIRPRQATAPEIAALADLLYHSHWDSVKHPRLAGWVVEAFDQLRLLDPACGSGAFPMGALLRMVEVLRVVDPGNQLWLERQIARLPAELRPAARKELSRENHDYARKLGLIKNALYGIDLQPLAVLITKLRFFISLLADQKLQLDDPAHNYGLTPLPNLETKILCANTLREVEHDLFAREAVRAYQAARDEYYQPVTTATRRAELVEIIAEKLSDVLPMFAEEVTGRRERSRALQVQRNRELLKEWFRHSTIPAPFFLFSVFFPEVCPENIPATLGGERLLDGGSGQQELGAPARAASAGFDIVIGNPPYGVDTGDDVRDALGLGSKDAYGAFLARFLRDGRSASPLRPDGILAYIVSDTFMTIKSHRPLRAQLMGSRVHKAIRVAGDTFNATVNTAILLVQKGGGPGTAPPTPAALATAEATGPWCQMVDLTHISIHGEEHDRFLTLLFDTAGSARRRDVSTESCAVYTYPQALIATNTNLPFFVASPKLFALARNSGNSRVLEVSRTARKAYEVQLNSRTLLLAKLGDDYSGRGATRQRLGLGLFWITSGIKTGRNDKFLRYLGSNAPKGLNTVDAEKTLSDDEAASLSNEQKLSGIVGERSFVRFEMGVPSDSQSGHLPCYWHPPSNIFIDWSEKGVRGMHAEPHSDLANTEFRFRHPDSQISFSMTGEYAPTFRTADAPVYVDKASRITLDAGVSRNALLGFLNSKLARFIYKTLINHGPDVCVDDIKELPVPLSFSESVGLLVASLTEKQNNKPDYDYASHEQLEIDRLVYEAYGLNRADIAEVETWYARRYPILAAAQRRNLRALGKLPAADRWNVYCDETGHLPHDRAPHLILGALLVPRERVRPLTEALRERLLAAGLPQTKSRDGQPAHLIELKWTKVSPAGLRFYETALDFFATEPDLRFRALVAPKSLPPAKLARPPAGAEEPGSPAWEAYNAQLEATAPAAVDYLHRHEQWYYDRYFDLLRETLLPPAHHAIYVDVKDTRGGPRIRELEDRLSDAHYDWTRSGVAERVQQIESHDVLLDQLADILLGALAWIHSTPSRNAGHSPSPAKQALAERVRALIAAPSAGLLPKIVVEHSPERSPSA